ncbi:MAG: hypothetical protein AAB583_05660, partial [Patescibacteria group bacterium]
MGFIEDLRRQKALRAQELEDAQKFARAREEQRRTLLAQAEGKRRKIETEESERYHRELEQAKAYFAKSEFPRLSEELVSIVGGITLSSYSDYGRDRPDQSAQFGIKLKWNE